jgi:hypothetical protein
MFGANILGDVFSLMEYEDIDRLNGHICDHLQVETTGNNSNQGVNVGSASSKSRVTAV